LMVPFGHVEIIERTPYFDVGPNGKGAKQPTWLAVCLETCDRRYLGRFVIVREHRLGGSLYVFAVDQEHVLYSENADNTPTFAFDKFYAELERAGLTQVWEDQQAGEQARRETEAAEEWKKKPVPLSYRLFSKKHGSAVVDVGVDGNITSASGQFMAFRGMEFHAFIRGLKQDDGSVKYRRLDWGD
jgi:hypothetical protein